MAKNYRQDGERLNFKAALTAGVTSGLPTIEYGWHGIPQTTAAKGEDYALDVGTRVYEHAAAIFEGGISGVKVGWYVYILEALGTERLKAVAKTSEAPGSSLLFGRVSATPTEGADISNKLPAAGNLLVRHGAN